MSVEKQCGPMKFEFIDAMPQFPKLGIPDYSKLSDEFADFVFDPENGVLRYDDEVNPSFTAYTEGNGSEMVTWGIIAVGEKLRGRDAEWLGRSYSAFFNDRLGIYLNSAGHERIEYWYLFYVNTLAGALWRSLYPEDRRARERWLLSSKTMLKLAKKIGYDFNDQGIDFGEDNAFTVKDMYRQPDSIAGYGYNMLFTAVHGGGDKFLEEAVHALKLYQALPENPWYEIPNGSAAVLAGAWLAAMGYEIDVERITGFVFDHKQGPLQFGEWNGEEINGLMMGWRGDNREHALSSAYSMETLMPLQFLLPAVRYTLGLAASVGKYALHTLANFQLFYGKGTSTLYETRPDLSSAVPYEKLERERDGYSPCACGDFMGHRSVYGGGYLMWLDVIVRKTEFNHVPAFDISLTDWLSKASYPTFLVYNPYDRAVDVSFTVAKPWEAVCPQLFKDGRLGSFELYSLDKHCITDRGMSRKVKLHIPAKTTTIIALLPEGSDIQFSRNQVFANGIPIDFSYPAAEQESYHI